MATVTSTVEHPAMPGAPYWKPSHNPWAVAMTVTLATFMEVLDTSIANVALPHIAGGMGADRNESTWILTSYLVSNAIVLPISAWLSRVVGRKRFYMTCVALFGASSFLCGLAPTLGFLVLFRILQGIGGGGLQPSEQAILADTFPPQQRGMAFAVYGMAVVIAPAIGPTVGGWITDNYTWRWIFYINVPIAILSLFLSHRLVEDPPYVKEERARHINPKVDWTGLGLLVIGVACLQLVLDKGQEEDWFSSYTITAALSLGVACLACWFAWEWKHPDPIVDVRMFKRRNFACAMLFTFCLGMVLFGTTVIIPQFLQLQLGYSAINAGEALAGGGLAMLVMMPVAGFLVTKMDPRLMMSCGFAATAGSMYYMTTHLALGMDFRTAALLRTIQAIGLPLIFLPSNTLAYYGVPREKNNQLAAMNSFVRNIGGSIGIALISTLITRFTQKHQSILVGHAYPGNKPFDDMVSGLAQNIMTTGVGAAEATQQAYARVMGMIMQQATTLAYVEVVSLMALVVACLLPLPFIMKRPPKQQQRAPGH